MTPLIYADISCSHLANWTDRQMDGSLYCFICPIVDNKVSMMQWGTDTGSEKERSSRSREVQGKSPVEGKSPETGCKLFYTDVLWKKHFVKL